MSCVKTSYTKLWPASDHYLIQPRAAGQFSNKFYRIYMTRICFLEKGV